MSITLNPHIFLDIYLYCFELTIATVIENLCLRRAKPFNPRYAGLRSNQIHVFSSRFLVKRSQAPFLLGGSGFLSFGKGELEILANVRD